MSQIRLLRQGRLLRISRIPCGLANYELNGKGENELKILRTEFNTMLNVLPNKAALFEVSKMHFDIESSMTGKKQRKDERGRYSVLRVGEKNDGWARSISKMTKEGITTPPAIDSFSKMQRSFIRNVRRMITDTIINNRDVYDDATKEKRGKSSTSDSTNKSTSTSEKTNNTILTDKSKDADLAIVTPPPTKKARRNESSNVNKTSSEPTSNINATSPQLTANAASTGNGKFNLVEKALGKDASLIGADDPDLDKLMMQIVKLKQMMTNNKLLLKYKDVSNGKTNSFVNIPTNTTDRSFTKLAAWIEEVFGVNGRRTLRSTVRRELPSTSKRTTPRHSERYSKKKD